MDAMPGKTSTDVRLYMMIYKQELWTMQQDGVPVCRLRGHSAIEEFYKQIRSGNISVFIPELQNNDNKVSLYIAVQSESMPLAISLYEYLSVKHLAKIYTAYVSVPQLNAGGPAAVLVDLGKGHHFGYLSRFYPLDHRCYVSYKMHQYLSELASETSQLSQLEELPRHVLSLFRQHPLYLHYDFCREEIDVNKFICVLGIITEPRWFINGLDYYFPVSLMHYFGLNEKFFYVPVTKLSDQVMINRAYRRDLLIQCLRFHDDCNGIFHDYLSLYSHQKGEEKSLFHTCTTFLLWIYLAWLDELSNSHRGHILIPSGIIPDRYKEDYRKFVSQASSSS